MDYFHNINVVNTQYERILRDQSVIWHVLHENESISVKFTSLIVGVFEKTSKEIIHISSLSAILHKISDQKKRFVEDEW